MLNPHYTAGGYERRPKRRLPPLLWPPQTGAVPVVGLPDYQPLGLLTPPPATPLQLTPPPTTPLLTPPLQHPTLQQLTPPLQHHDYCQKLDPPPLLTPPPQHTEQNNARQQISSPPILTPPLHQTTSAWQKVDQRLLLTEPFYTDNSARPQS